MVNPYRERFLARPRNWRNLLANRMVMWAERIAPGHLAQLTMSAAYAQGWRDVCPPEPPHSQKPSPPAG